jgi:alkylation response protein AidB-like acyl-CoA dehydrogenase
MDFEISEKMQAILEMMNEFVDKELIPLEPEYLNVLSWISFRSWRKKETGKTDGTVGPQHPPKEYGGLGLDLVELGPVGSSGRSSLGHSFSAPRPRCRQY